MEVASLTPIGFGRSAHEALGQLVMGLQGASSCEKASVQMKFVVAVPKCAGCGCDVLSCSEIPVHGLPIHRKNLQRLGNWRKLKKAFANVDGR